MVFIYLLQLLRWLHPSVTLWILWALTLDGTNHMRRQNGCIILLSIITCRNKLRLPCRKHHISGLLLRPFNWARRWNCRENAFVLRFTTLWLCWHCELLPQARSCFWIITSLVYISVKWSCTDNLTPNAIVIFMHLHHRVIVVCYVALQFTYLFFQIHKTFDFLIRLIVSLGFNELILDIFLLPKQKFYQLLTLAALIRLFGLHCGRCVKVLERGIVVWVSFLSVEFVPVPNLYLFWRYLRCHQDILLWMSMWIRWRIRVSLRNSLKFWTLSCFTWRLSRWSLVSLLESRQKFLISTSHCLQLL